jgi:membrane protease YdiL (CAAX protease family)
LAGWVRQHPLIAYFSLAFAGTWGIFGPVWLGKQGLGVLPMQVPDVVAILLFLVSTLMGPTLAAFVVTALQSGKPGVRQLLRRYVQLKVGLGWYALLLVGYPLLVVSALSASLGSWAPWGNLFTQWPAVFTAYLPAILFNFIFPAFLEEPGWRGFALPHLQSQYGPLVGSLVLGVLHAIWHLPVYVVPGMMQAGSFDLTNFISNSLAIVAATVLWAWLFNNGKGSIFFAMLIHAVSNASVSYAVGITSVLPNNPWMTAELFGLVALVLIVATRGRLGYQTPARDFND